ncbi:MAG: CBS domain-containing protein [Pseudomonadota bacterium]|nr:CBS domain-containing protein [Pseudomonadota bacterium]
MNTDGELDQGGGGKAIPSNGGAMTVESVMIPTGIAHPDMTVRDLFVECGRAQVQALPFGDGNGQVTGRVTLKNVLRLSCLPDFMVELAPLLTSRLSCVEHAEDKAREIICQPIEPYVQAIHKTIPSSEPLIKALALMERGDTSYIFVVDDGVYQGVITIQGIAASMAELSVCIPER